MWNNKKCFDNKPRFDLTTGHHLFKTTGQELGARNKTEQHWVLHRTSTK
jgi:hypothetical protein